ncbi:MAG: hypothetical protein ACRDFS_05360 [Chloroflexota bacterium]
MCASCGCGELNNDHGDPKNITIEMLQQAAEAGGVTVKEAAENIRRGVDRARVAVASK